MADLVPRRASDPEAPTPLEQAHAQRSPLRARHAEAHRLYAEGHAIRGPRDLLYGEIHGVRRPTLCLMAWQVLGPVRHALAQRTVAGTHEVRFVPVVRPSTVAAAAKDPPKKE